MLSALRSIIVRVANAKQFGCGRVALRSVKRDRIPQLASTTAIVSYGALHVTTTFVLHESLLCSSRPRLADAIGFMKKRKLGEVPSFVNDWRARRDSNPLPLGS